MKSAKSIRNYLNGVKLYHILNDAVSKPSRFSNQSDFEGFR